MSQAEGWTDEDTAAFLSNEDLFVPERERQIATVVQRVLDVAGEAPRVVELCSGSGRLARALLESRDDLRLIAYDGSETMLARTRESAGTHASRLTMRSFQLESEAWRTIDRPLDAVVSSLAIHHLDGPEKQALFAYVSSILKPGGVFVVADLIEPASDSGRRLLARQWDEEVGRRSRELLGGPQGLERFRALGWNYYELTEPDPVDKPSRLAEQLDWMRQAGFAEVDLHWCLAGHAIFSGVRPKGPER